MAAGISSFNLIVTIEQYQKLLETVHRYQQIVELVGVYEIGDGKDNRYMVAELFVDFPGRSELELCRFIYGYFSFICLHQANSTYIFISNKDDFIKLLQGVYGRDNKQFYLLYDILTIKDRYNICMKIGKLDPFAELRINHIENGNVYNLLLDEECPQLFTDESEIQIIDDYTGEVKTIDILEGLPIFKFNLALLTKNLEKKTEKIL